MQYYFQGLERRTGDMVKDGDTIAWDNCFVQCTLKDGFSDKGTIYGCTVCQFKLKAANIDRVFGIPVDDLIKDIDMYIGEPIDLQFAPNDKGGFDVCGVRFVSGKGET